MRDATEPEDLRAHGPRRRVLGAAARDGVRGRRRRGRRLGLSGVLSGNSVQVSVDAPVNACGNSVDGRRAQPRPGQFLRAVWLPRGRTAASGGAAAAHVSGEGGGAGAAPGEGTARGMRPRAGEAGAEQARPAGHQPAHAPAHEAVHRPAPRPVPDQRMGAVARAGRPRARRCWRPRGPASSGRAGAAGGCCWAGAAAAQGPYATPVSGADDADHRVGRKRAVARGDSGAPGRSGRPSGSGGPLGLGRPVEPAVGITGRSTAGRRIASGGGAAAGSRPSGGTTDRADQRVSARSGTGRIVLSLIGGTCLAGRLKCVEVGVPRGGCRAVRPLAKWRKSRKCDESVRWGHAHCAGADRLRAGRGGGQSQDRS
ncbi:chaplin [Streptomyces endophytica]|uniref:chaplin n=1 Tax=Streptomyces endophytica TaxID=2991496 RepID=UPI003C6F1047